MVPVDIVYDISLNQHKDLIRIAEQERLVRKVLKERPARQPLADKVINWMSTRWTVRDLTVQTASVQEHPSNPACTVVESAG